jgi:hypothetical protein
MTSANAADRSRDVQHRHDRRRSSNPGDRDEHTAAADHDPGPELVDSALERHQPRLSQDEDRERHLDSRAAPLVFLIDRIDEQVQPYCRLAIITMQMMPKISWPQRVASEACARASTDSVAAVISYPR